MGRIYIVADGERKLLHFLRAAPSASVESALLEPSIWPAALPVWLAASVTV